MATTYEGRIGTIDKRGGEEEKGPHPFTITAHSLEWALEKAQDWRISKEANFTGSGTSLRVSRSQLLIGDNWIDFDLKHDHFLTSFELQG